MKSFYGDQFEKEYIKSEKKKGIKIAETTLCEDFLYHHYFFITRYIRYHDIVRMYRLTEAGESGDFAVEEHKLVLVDPSGKEHRLHVDRAEYVHEIMEYIQTKNPNVMIRKKD